MGVSNHDFFKILFWPKNRPQESVLGGNWSLWTKKSRGIRIRAQKAKKKNEKKIQNFVKRFFEKFQKKTKNTPPFRKPPIGAFSTQHFCSGILGVWLLLLASPVPVRQRPLGDDDDESAQYSYMSGPCALWDPKPSKWLTAS